MFAKLYEFLGKIDADFADARFEIIKKTRIAFSGKVLTEVTANSTDGFVIRTLINGGLSSVTFTQEDDYGRAIVSALEQARLLGRGKVKPVSLAPVEPVKDTFIPDLNKDPRDVPIDEKIEMLRTYNDIALSHDKIATTTIAYEDVVREKYYLNSEGSEVREDLITTRITGEVIAQDGSLIQNVRVGLGGSNGYSTVCDQEEYIEKRTQIVLDLLRAEPATSGTTNCVLNPSMGGLLIHEALGHYSEADMVENLPTIREKMRIGAKLGNELLSILDNPALPNQLGHYKYDDEGVAVRPVQIMKNGVLTGRLHSRQTASEFGESVTGHCIAEDFRYAPIVRMGTIFVEPTDTQLETLMEQLDDGLYVLDGKGGATLGENFTFGAQYGYLVRNGKRAGMVRDFNVSGNLFQTLQNIMGIANDLSLSKTGGCGKEQKNIRSCHGSPHLLVSNLIVGGVA